MTFFFYHGKKIWGSAKSIAELFTDFSIYLSEGLKKTFLVNLTNKPIEEIKQWGRATSSGIVLSHQASGDILPLFPELYKAQAKDPDCCRRETSGYILLVEKRPEGEVIDEMAKFDPETAKNFKNMFERAIASAVRSTARIERKKGLQEGRKEERAAIFEKLLKAGVDKRVLEKALQKE